MSIVNPYARYQKGLVISDIFPSNSQGLCACGCGRTLTGHQKRWSSKKCERYALTEFLIIKGDIQTIRNELFKRDEGICAFCGRSDNWQADHILPVASGGGASTLDNFNTLCISCHKEKTISQIFSAILHKAANSLQAASTPRIRILNAAGADSQC